MDPLIVALAVTLVIWIGLFLYMRRTDSKLKKLEEKS